MKWAEVIAQPAFAALSDDEQEFVRNDFFDSRVKPHVAAGDLEAIREDYDNYTTGTLQAIRGKKDVDHTQYETKLSPMEEDDFQKWKAAHYPDDSGQDYDLRGLFKESAERWKEQALKDPDLPLNPKYQKLFGTPEQRRMMDDAERDARDKRIRGALSAQPWEAPSPKAENGHSTDRYKKPNHPTFSDQSMYADQRPDLVGHWEGDQFVPPEITGSKWLRKGKDIGLGLTAGGAGLVRTGMEAAEFALAAQKLAPGQVLARSAVDRLKKASGLNFDFVDKGAKTVEEWVWDPIKDFMGRVNEAMEEEMSPELKEAKRRQGAILQSDDHFIRRMARAAWETISDPDLAANALAESAAFTGTGLKLSNVVFKDVYRTTLEKTIATLRAQGVPAANIEKLAKDKAAETAREAVVMAQTIINGFGEGGSQAAQARDEVMAMPDSAFLGTPEYEKAMGSPQQRRLMDEGERKKRMKEVREAVADRAATIAFAVNAPIGAGATRLTHGGIDPSLASRTGKRALSKEMFSGLVEEPLEEGIQGAGGQLSVNIAKQQTVSPEQPLLEGVPEAAGQGAGAGVLFGGGGTMIAGTKAGAGAVADKVTGQTPSWATPPGGTPPPPPQGGSTPPPGGSPPSPPSGPGTGSGREPPPSGVAVTETPVPAGPAPGGPAGGSGAPAGQEDLITGEPVPAPAADAETAQKADMQAMKDHGQRMASADAALEAAKQSGDADAILNADIAVREARLAWAQFLKARAERAGRTDSIAGYDQQIAAEQQRLDQLRKMQKPSGVTSEVDVATLPQTVDAGAHEAATSPTNDLAEPTQAQAQAGNYKVGPAKVGPLDISVENPEGSVREDKANVPPKWSQEMKAHYGYIKGTVGYDKDHVDVFVKPGTPENWNGTVYVVNQNKGDGSFDEHKSMVGYDSEEEARAAYLENYEKGWESRIHSIASMPMEEFDKWARNKGKKNGPKAGPAVSLKSAQQRKDEATVARSKRAKARMQERMKPKDTDDLITLIAKWGGWDYEEAIAHGMEARDARLGPRGMPGVLFMKKTGPGRITLADIAQRMYDMGFDVKDDNDIGAGYDDNKALDLINRAISGEPIYSPAGIAARAAEAAGEYEEDSYYGEPEGEVRAAVDTIRKAFDDIGLTESEIETLADRAQQEELDNEDIIAAAYETAEERGNQEGDGSVQEAAGSEGSAEEAPLLDSYTEEDIRQREAEEAARQEQRKADDDKAAADAERDSFVLTGSTREADEAAARGQGDLMAQPAPKIPDNVMRAVKALVAAVGEHARLFDLAGPRNAKIRAEIMSHLLGTKATQSGSGVNALRDAFYKAAGISGGTEADREDAFAEWVRQHNRSGSPQFSLDDTGAIDKATADVVKAWRWLSNAAGLFTFPATAEKAMEKIAAEFSKRVGKRVLVSQIDVKPDSEMIPAKDRRVKYWQVTMPDGSIAKLEEYADGTITANASLLNQHESMGTALFQLGLAYAHNNGLVFIGDPDGGLSPAAFVRLIESMASSALKYGTTKHMRPDPTQTTKGPRPIDWKEGQDAHNLAELLLTSYANTRALVPEIEKLRYDPASQKFYDEKGEVFDDARFEALATRANRKNADAIAAVERAGGRDGGGPAVVGRSTVREMPVVGVRTLKRAVVTGSVSRGASEASRGSGNLVLEEIGRQLETGLDPNLAGTQYSLEDQQEPAQTGIGKEKLLKRLGNFIKRVRELHGMRVVVLSMDELRQRIKVPPGKRVRGAIDGNTIYLVHDVLRSGMEADIALGHELIGHFGIENVVKNWGEVVKLMRQLMQNPKGEFADILAEVDRRYGDRYRAGEMTELEYMKEIIAVTTERNLKDGAIGQLLRKIRLGIRRFLQAIGIHTIFGPSEIDAMIAASTHYVFTGTSPFAENMAGPVSTAKPMFSYVGPKARFAHNQRVRSDLSVARSMALNGKFTPAEIRMATGWFRGKFDGQWRYEVTDHRAKFKVDWANNDIVEATAPFGTKKQYRLGDILDHPELFAMYPELADVKVAKRSAWLDFFGATQGWYTPEANEIVVSPKAQEPLSTLMHEIQHWIQFREGFATGGNEEMVLKATSNEHRLAAVDAAISKSEQLIVNLQRRIGRNLKEKAALATAQRLYQQHGKLLDELVKAENAWLEMETTSDNFKERIALSNKERELKKRFLAAAFGKDNYIKLSISQQNQFIAARQLAKAKVNLVTGFMHPIHRMMVINRDISKTIDQYQEQIRLLERLRATDGSMKEFEELAKEKAIDKFELYQALAGEIEARDTQARQNMTEEERAYEEPYNSEYYRPEQAIVIFDQQGNATAYSLADPVDDGKWYYSQALRAVGLMTQEKASPEQWMAHFKKNGVKDAELDWLDVNVFMAEKKTVSKDEMEEFIRKNQVSLNEVVLGEKYGNLHDQDYEYMVLKVELDAAGYSVEADLDDFMVRRRSDGTTFKQYLDNEGMEDTLEHLPDVVREQALRLFELWNIRVNETTSGISTSDAARYEQFTLPGGEKYRELLLTLPAQGTARDALGGDPIIQTREQAVEQDEIGVEPDFYGPAGTEVLRYPNGLYIMKSPDGVYRVEVIQEGIETRNLKEAESWLASRATGFAEPQGPDFHSNHWDTPNIVVHVRFKERVGADGKRVLFIEEIQSDWATTIRNDGIRVPWSNAQDAELTKARKELNTALRNDDDLGFDTLKEARAAILRHDDYADRWELSEDTKAAAEKYIPLYRAWAQSQAGAVEGPYVTDTRQYVMLAMKRMIRWAAENGFDRVAWTTGQQQKDRYDLGQVIKFIEIVDRTHSITEEKDKALRFHLKGRYGQAFTLGVGNDGIIDNVTGTGDREWKGKPLSEVIGKDLADKVMAAKHGDIVQGEGFDLGGKFHTYMYDVVIPQETGKYIKKWGGKVTDLTVGTRTFSALESPEEFKVQQEPVRGFDVTDAMREAAMAGQPMFSMADPVDSPAFKRWFGNSKVVDENGGAMQVYHSGEFDENEHGIPDVNHNGFHFGTKVAAEMRDVQKYKEDEILSIVTEQDEESGKWYWRSDSFDSYDWDETGYDSDEDARSGALEFINEQQDIGIDAEPRHVTIAYLSIQNPKRVSDQGDDWQGVIRQAKADGFDGLVYRNKYEDEGSDSWVAFSPEQIKSATGNNGQYDPKNPNIMFSLDDAATAGVRSEKVGRIKALMDQVRPLAEKGALTRDEAEQFRALMAEVNSLRFDVAKPLNIDKIPSPQERDSTLPSDLVLTARNDLMANKPAYTAIMDAMIGTMHDAETAVDEIMRGNNPEITASGLYNAFSATRKAMRDYYGDRVTLYRAIGKQREKPTTNWATTESYARQFGDKVIERSVPVENVIAVNVAANGKYHEVIVGSKPSGDGVMFSFEDAKDHPMYLERDYLQPMADDVVARAIASDPMAKKIAAKDKAPMEGERVGVRLNLNVLKNTGVAVQTIHAGGKTEGYRKNKGFWGGEVVAYLGTVTLKNAYFNVGQAAREKIATGQSSKMPMASIDGEFASGHSFNGVEVRFNPKDVHLFTDLAGRPVRFAEYATVQGHRAYLRGRIEFYTRATAPARAGDAPSNVMFSLASQYHEDNERIRGRDKSVWDKATNMLRKYLAPGGLLPPDVVELDDLRKAEIGRSEFDQQHIVGQLERAVKAGYGKRYGLLDQMIKDMLNDALGGQIPEKGDIPDDVWSAIVAMRRLIDSYSYRMADILEREVDELMPLMASADEQAVAVAKAKIKLLQTILGNIGTYMHRSYQAHDDSGWVDKVPDDVMNAARAYLIDQLTTEDEETGEPGMDFDEAKRRADNIIESMLKDGTAYESFHGWIRESKLGAKDLSILMKRGDIAEPLRALLGEYKDVRVNFTRTIAKVSRYVANQMFLNAVKEIGMGVFLFKDADRPLGNWKKIALERDNSLSPLNGLYTTPEIEFEFQNQFGKERLEGLLGTIIIINGIVKAGLTVGSPFPTGLRNWTSGLVFALMNGDFNLAHTRESAMAMREYFTHMGKGKRLAYLRRLRELGVSLDNPYPEEMMRHIADSKIESLFAADSLMRVREILGYFNKFYQFGDDFWKISGFENKKRQYMRAGMSQEEAEVMAARRIRDTYPTYSKVGRLFRMLRRNPLVGTFVSFPAEVVRTHINQFRYMAEDYKAGRKAMAAQQIAGIILGHGFVLALAFLSKAANDIDDKDEEAVRLMSPTWQENSTFMFLPRDESGEIRYWDMSYTDPYNMWRRPFTALLRDGPWTRRLGEAVAEAVMPFFGPEIGTKTWVEVITNKNWDTGKPIVSDGDSTMDAISNIAEFIYTRLRPSSVRTIDNLIKSVNGYISPSGRKYKFEEEWKAALGVRVQTMDPKRSLYFRSYDFSGRLRSASEGVYRALRDPNEVSDADIGESYARLQRIRTEAFNEMHVLVEAAIGHGMNEDDVKHALKDMGVSKENIKGILKNEAPDWSPSKQSEDNAETLAKLLISDEVADRIVDRYRKFRRTARGGGYLQ